MSMSYMSLNTMTYSSLLLCKLSRPLINTSPPTSYYLYNSIIKRYKQSSSSGRTELSQLRGVEEKAPSLADEFKRVAEEKAKVEETSHATEDEGIANQSLDKTFNGAEEVAAGCGDTEVVKQRIEEHETGADYRKSE